MFKQRPAKIRLDTAMIVFFLSMAPQVLKAQGCFSLNQEQSNALLVTLTFGWWDSRLDLSNFVTLDQNISSEYHSISVFPLMQEQVSDDALANVDKWISDVARNGDWGLEALIPESQTDDIYKDAARKTAEIIQNSFATRQTKVAAAFFLQSKFDEASLLYFYISLSQDPFLDANSVSELHGCLLQTARAKQYGTAILLYSSLAHELNQLMAEDRDNLILDECVDNVKTKLKDLRDAKFSYVFRLRKGDTQIQRTIVLPLYFSSGGDPIGHFNVSTTEYLVHEELRSGKIASGPRLLLQRQLSDLMSHLKYICIGNSEGYRKIGNDVLLLINRCLQCDDFVLHNKAARQALEFSEFVKNSTGESTGVILSPESANCLEASYAEREFLFGHPVLDYYELLRSVNN